jgi:ParB family chromosome partitioning protein
LAEAFISKKVNASSSFAILSKLSTELSSDDRLEQLMREITRRGARPSEGREATPVPGVTIKSGRGSIAMSIKRAGENAAFADWLDRELENIIKKSYQEFTAVNPEDDTRG